MADKSKIEWCDATWQIVTGCSIVSPGCTNCYAMRFAGTRLREHPSRQGLTKSVNGNPVWTGEVRFNEQWLMQPLRWRRPRRIFVAAHGDMFHENVPDEWIDRVFAVMALAPWHSFMVLTKRPERMREYLLRPTVSVNVGLETLGIVLEHPKMALGGKVIIKATDINPGALKEWPLPNVMLGVTAEDQARADERITHLIETPAAKRFVSVEPMLGPVDLTRIQVAGDDDFDGGFLDALGGGIYIEQPMPPRLPHIPDWVARLNWVIVGGESGRGARPMHPNWARGVRDQCAAAGVPFFFKQWGEWFPRSQWEHNPRLVLPDDDFAFTSDAPYILRFEDRIDGIEVMHRVGKRRAGRLLDGVEHNEFPR